VDGILQGTAPHAVRLAAARGALPLPRPILFRLLVALTGAAEEEIRTAAGSSVKGWPREEIESIASDPACSPEVLSFLVDWEGCDGELLAIVLANPSLPVDVLIRAATAYTSERIDLLLANQTLLIRSPALLEAIERNASASPLHRSRVDEIRRHFLGGSPGDDRKSAPPVQGPPLHGSADAVSAPAAMAPTAAGPPVLAPPVDGSTDPLLHEGVMQRILKMNVGEKIVLAARGTREERTVLIRDSNRSVQDAVINSPKISDSEVETIARMRNVNEDILRQIAGHRDWMKSYTIVLGLASNPKTPLGISLSLLSRLTLPDLKVLQTDKNVSDALRRSARKAVELRVNKGGGSSKKGH
jgi:hypothetical protein